MRSAVRYYVAMGSAPSDTTLVRHVRTFADDVRRAQGKDAPRETSGRIEKSAPKPAHAEAVRTEPAHAIDEQLTASVAEQSGKESHLADTKKPLDIRKEASGEAGEAVIVSDKRRHRWSLTRAIARAVGSWARAPRPAPAPHVSEAAQHKPHIQKKAAQSAKDNIQRKRAEEQALAQLRAHTHKRTSSTTASRAPAAAAEARKFARSAAAPAPQAVRDIAPSAPQIPDTDTRAQRATQEPPVNLPVGIEAASEESYAPTTPHHEAMEPVDTPRPETPPAPPSQAPSEISAPAPQHAAQPEAAATQRRQRVDAERRAAIEKLLQARLHTEARNEVAPAEHAAPPQAAQQPASAETQLDVAPVTPASQHAQAQPTEQRASVKASTHSVQRAEPALSPRPFLIAGLTMLAIILVGGFGFFWYARDAGRPDTSIVRIPTFIAIDAQQPAQFSENRAVLLDTLTASLTSARGTVTQIYLTENDADRAIDTERFMRVLDPRAPGSFLRNLSPEMMFGAYRQSEPFLIVRTERFDTAFAGMLDWEPFMSADLMPLFGEPVSRTFDPAARTTDVSRPAFFVDESVDNTTVRTLYDERASERIVYAFRDQRTLIITTNKAALAELLTRF